MIAACSRPAAVPGAQPAAHAEMQTIETADPRPARLDPPPVLTDEAPPPKPKNPFEAEKAIPLTPEDERIRTALPFTPAIAMDPVDGSKVSIRATTPTLEYKNRIYYFSTEANRRSFSANPEQYVRGTFAHM